MGKKVLAKNKPSVQSPSEVEEVLESLPEQKQQIIKAAMYAVEKHSFSGPLPRPEDFAKYKDTLPDAPERILAMAEKQQNHRMELEATIVKEDIVLSKRGQWLGFILAIFFGIIAAWLGFEGHDTLAGIIATAVIVALVAIFVLRKEPSATNDVPLPDNRK